MRPFLARFSEPVWSGHLPSWADFITTTPELKFSVHTGVVDTPMSGDDEIRAKLVEAQEMLEALQSGNLHIDHPFEGRTEAKIYDLRRQIAEYQSILDKRHAPRP
jgi:hypothetical protein